MKKIFEGNIVSDFRGWNRGNLFKTDNGQLWVQAEYAYLYHYEFRPNAIIYEENGQYFLRVQGIDGDLRVKKCTDYVESTIISAFKGFRDRERFELSNNQHWVQNESKYSYHYSYRPNTIIYNDGFEYLMKVDGVNEIVKVKRER